MEDKLSPVSTGESYRLDLTGFVDNQVIMDLYSQMLAVRRGVWSPIEDDILCNVMNKKGDRTWEWVGSHLPGRNGKQSRERWMNYLDPALARTPIKQNEKIILAHMMRVHGKSWTELTQRLNNWRCKNGLKGTRSPNQIKNTSNTTGFLKLAAHIPLVLDSNAGIGAYDTSIGYHGRVTFRTTPHVIKPKVKTTMFRLNTGRSNDYAYFNLKLVSRNNKYTRKGAFPLLTSSI